MDHYMPDSRQIIMWTYGPHLSVQGSRRPLKSCMHPCKYSHVDNGMPITAWKTKGFEMAKQRKSNGNERKCGSAEQLIDEYSKSRIDLDSCWIIYVQQFRNVLDSANVAPCGPSPWCRVAEGLSNHVCTNGCCIKIWTLFQTEICLSNSNFQCNSIFQKISRIYLG